MDHFEYAAKRQVVGGGFLGVTTFLGMYYTFDQLSIYRSLVGSLDLLIAVRFFIVIGITSILAAYFYRKYGFLAAISLRLGDYFVWHIIWGAIAKI